MKALEQALGYVFKDPTLLRTALTHSSYANEQKKEVKYNERLEFLGDSVLSVIVSEYLFTHLVDCPEGELTRIRAALVCEKSLCSFARQINLGEYLLLGKGEKNNHGQERPSILADAFEAVLAAMYLDGGFAPAKKHVLRFVGPELEQHKDAFNDYKTVLQEIIQRNPEEQLSYAVVSEEGPDHDKRFQVEVRLNSNVLGVGVGRSKKSAEQQAAKQALELMGQPV